MFRNSLRVALSEEGARLSLLNGQFSRRTAEGDVEQSSIADADDLLEVLRQRFHLQPAPGEIEVLRMRLAQLLPPNS